MIYVLTGENDFALRRKLSELLDVGAERYDGIELSFEQLADICAGSTLFSSKRQVVIDSLGDNKHLWSEAIPLLERAGEDTTLVLVEPKPDKRTKTFKWLQKNAEIIDHKPWTERDSSKAAAWVQEQIKSRGIKVNPAEAQFLVHWVGVNQQDLHQAIEKLELVGVADEKAIKSAVDPAMESNVFILLETALKGDGAAIKQQIDGLERSDDAYRVLGLLASQIQQLVALVLGGKSSSLTAADMGVSPFMMNRLTPYSRSMDRKVALSILEWTAEADRLTKTVDNDPWMIVEKLLLKIVAVKQ